MANRPVQRDASAALAALISFGVWLSLTCSAQAEVAPVDAYRLVAQPVATDLLRVTGLPGSVAPTSQVVVINTNRPRRGQQTVTPAADGSFSAQVVGSRGHRLSVAVRNQAGDTSSPTFVYAGALTIKNPYEASSAWRVGQVHTHTTNSDGVDSPGALEAAYAAAGYDFVVSTDHRGPAPTFTDADDGMTPDPVSASGNDLFWIPGAEIGNSHVHLGSWGTSSNLSLFEMADTQLAIDATRARGGIAVINHPENPKWTQSWEWNDEIVPIRNVSLVEAFNAKHGTVIERHIADAIDLADDFQQVWWIGADDCHDINEPGRFNQYAIVVQADTAQMNQADLLAAADAGRFYIRETAQGPGISSVTVSGNTVNLTLPDIASAYEVLWYRRGGELQQRNPVVDTSVSFTAAGFEGYVRAEVTRISDGKKAYTQPLFIGNGEDLAVAASNLALVDNDSSTVWDANAATGTFVVDTGSVHPLNAIRIDWDGTGGRRFNYSVEVSDTGEFLGEQRPVGRPTYSNRSALTLDFFDAASRFVRVVITGQTAGAPATARVREVEVFDSTPARTDLYIDNVNGDDANSGLAGQPWRTFNHARDRVRPRDTLNFAQNTAPYPGEMRLESVNSGKHAGATVEYRGAGGTPARIDASGADLGIGINNAQWLKWSDFDISLANGANLLVYGGANVVIERNRLHGAQGRGFVGAGDFTLAYNLIYGNGTDGVLLYTDGTDGKIYNNVLYGNGVDGLTIQNVGTVKATIRNNISAGNGRYAFSRDFTPNVVDSHNCVKGSSYGDYDGLWSRDGSISADPRFNDPASGDFTLQATSPCIDAGIDLNYNADFAGEPVRDVVAVPNTGSPGAYSRTFTDMGAHEACDDSCSAGGGGSCHH